MKQAWDRRRKTLLKCCWSFRCPNIFCNLLITSCPFSALATGMPRSEPMPCCLTVTTHQRAAEPKGIPVGTLAPEPWASQGTACSGAAFGISCSSVGIFWPTSVGIFLTMSCLLVRINFLFFHCCCFSTICRHGHRCIRADLSLSIVRGCRNLP